MAYVGRKPEFQNILVTRSNSGATVAVDVINTSNTASSKAAVTATVGGASANDAVFQAAISGVQTYTWGIDNSASDAWVLSAGTTLGTNNAISVDTAGVPTLTTPVLGVATATSLNKVAITAPATSATLTIADGKTLTASNSLTFTGTDGNSFAFPSGSSTVMTLASADIITGIKSFNDGNLALNGSSSGTGTLKAPAVASTYTWTLPAATGTIAYTGNKLDAFAATTSAELAGVISDESGSGALVFANSPTLVTPVLGVASATSLALDNGGTDGGTIYFDTNGPSYLTCDTTGVYPRFDGQDIFYVAGSTTNLPTAVVYSRNTTATREVLKLMKINNTTSEYYIRCYKNGAAYDAGGTGIGRIEDLADTFTLTTESDRRLKTNITPTSEQVLDKINQLQIVDYEFLTRPGEVVKMGMIAQDVNALFPSMVSKPDDGESPLVDDTTWAIGSSWHNILIKGIQELTARVQELENAG